MSRWIAAAGAFVISLDSMANIAFPALAAAFAVPPEQMRWVIVSYVGTYAVTSLVAGALADVLGHGRVFRVGLALSALGFFLVAVAPAFAWVLVGRFTQGLGGGMVYGTAPAIVTLAAAPGERGRALGFFNAAFAAGFALGPVLAGLLVQAIGWRAVFHVRVPLALGALVWALAALPRFASAGAPRLVRLHELVRGPVLHAGALSFMANAGIFAVWLLAPFDLVSRRELGAGVGGMIFMLTPLGTALAAPLAGRLADRVGARLPMTIGLALEAVGLFVMSRTDASLVVTALGLFAAGFGVGIFQVPNMTWTMSAFGAGQQGAAGGVTFLMRTSGIVAGVFVLSGVFGARRLVVGFDAAYTDAFVVAGFVVTAAALLAAVRPRAI
jgi:MFS family permease